MNLGKNTGSKDENGHENEDELLKTENSSRQAACVNTKNKNTKK